LILRACLQSSSKASRLPESVKKETAPFRSTKRGGERLIKTLFKKIVHNKNHIFTFAPADPGLRANIQPRLEIRRPYIHYLTNQAGFLQYSLKMTISENCKNSGLQSDNKVVYNHSIAVTQACHLTFRPPRNPCHEQDTTNKKEDCSER
jgi:hypothetical protein